MFAQYLVVREMALVSSGANTPCMCPVTETGTEGFLLNTYEDSSGSRVSKDNN